VDGRQIAESGALARLIARWAGAAARAATAERAPRRVTWRAARTRAGLYPADPVEAAAQEMVQQAANDLENVEPIFNGFTTEVRRLRASGAALHGR